MAVSFSKKTWGVSLLRKQRVGKVTEQQGWRNSLSLILLCMCLVSLALLHVWLRLQAVHLGYVLSTTTKLNGQLKQENRELKLELATLTSPDRLEKMARLRLRLREPQKGQVVILP